MTMDLYQRQQFDTLLQTAVERYVERLEQRNEGADRALSLLRADAEGNGIWLNQFVGVLFDDFLLNNPDGAAFVLRALPRRQLAAPSPGTVETMLVAMARSAFGELLRQKADEELERRSSFHTADSASKG